MTSLQELIATITARLTYEEDFTFDKKKEELALAARSRVAPRISALLDAPCQVSIDAEGDIALSANDAFMYVTSLGGSCTASRIPISALTTSNLVLALPALLAEVHQLRSDYLKPTNYGLRIYTRACSVGSSSIPRLQSLLVNSLPGTSSEHDVLSDFSCSYSFDVGMFKDTVEPSARPEEFTVRLSRQAHSNRFANFAEFWSKADIVGLVERVSPFLEKLDASSKGLRARSFLENAPSKD